ncbi:MAG: sulfite exporter TauE/SafE family protein, partial [Actinomycetes bacterium]
GDRAPDVVPPSTTVLREVPRHSPVTVAGLGAVAGFVAGLLGVGGGIVMVPVLTGPLKFPVRAATASSLVAVAIFSLPALVTHAVLGHINWFFATALMLGVVPGAQIGASLTIRSSERTIRTAFGVFIVLMAVVFAATQLVEGR